MLAHLCGLLASVHTTAPDDLSLVGSRLPADPLENQKLLALDTPFYPIVFSHGIRLSMDCMLPAAVWSDP